jgi:hypothetical protein
MLVRRSGKTASESKVCFKGTKTLTSLAVGFKVPQETANALRSRQLPESGFIAAL